VKTFDKKIENVGFDEIGIEAYFNKYFKVQIGNSMANFKEKQLY
jgi:hypothetical protein